MKHAKLLTVLLAAVLLLAVGCEREITGDVPPADNSSEGCLTCHSGLLDAAQGEWVNSVHASGANIDYTNRGGSDCTMCHDQQGFISYLETGELPDEPFETVSAIGCFTCHNPHVTGDFTLRATDPYTLANGDVFDHEAGNLCVACHHARKSADDITDDQSTSRYWSSHYGSQGDMLNTSNGWEFPGQGYSFADAKSPHATVVRDACAGCHMGQERVHDGYAVGGHTWNMVDEAGNNQAGICEGCHTDPDEDDAYEDYDFTADVDYDGDGAVEGYQTEIDGMMDDLRTLLVGKGVLDGSDHATSGTIADQHIAGALWNFLIILHDRSHGVHNFKYIHKLLESSIDYVTNN